MREGTPVPVIVTLELAYRLPMSYPRSGRNSRRHQPPRQDDEFLKGAYSAGTPGLVSPNLLATSQPRYTSDAMRAKIQGVVEVEAVVGTDGTVVRHAIKRSLDKDFGLDRGSARRGEQYTFEPGASTARPCRSLSPSQWSSGSTRSRFQFGSPMEPAPGSRHL